MKKIVVISLGGSVIIPDKINIDFLKEFKKVLLKNKRKYKFLVVCGGGKTARNYINGLEDEKIKSKEFLQCQLGIASTRLNARFMTYLFNEESNKQLPNDMIEVENLLRIHDIVFCGALRYEEEETSDSTSAKLARNFKAEFINITNVPGLYDKDPKKSRNAVFIPEINLKDFYKISRKIGFKPGQHFVLDKKAAKTIKKYKIPSYIIGPDMKNLDNLLNKRHFIGTSIRK